MPCRGLTFVSTTNACRQCTPLGAALAFRGIEGATPFLHGSQGCATYMRRYIISHFREPMDIASSSLGEKNAVFGGGPNLKKGLLNVRDKYGARLVGVATTCLTETIGDDLHGILHEFKKGIRSQLSDRNRSGFPHPVTMVPIWNGWHGALLATVRHLAGARARRTGYQPSARLCNTGRYPAAQNPS